MKLKFMLIGLALALMLCISPVAAVSGNDFEIEIDESGIIYSYKYCNVNDPDEEYFEIFTQGTTVMHSFVTFKPANIPDAPKMVVSTYGGIKEKIPLPRQFSLPRKFYLPKSVDEWVIKYYSSLCYESKPKPRTLKNACVINLNEYFGENAHYFYLELSAGQFILSDTAKCYIIPDVKAKDEDNDDEWIEV